MRSRLATLLSSVSFLVCCIGLSAGCGGSTVDASDICQAAVARYNACAEQNGMAPLTVEPLRPLDEQRSFVRAIGGTVDERGRMYSAEGAELSLPSAESHCAMRPAWRAAADTYDKQQVIAPYLACAELSQSCGCASFPR